MKTQKSQKKKILVIGDLIIDVYHQGSYLGQSVDNVETPVALKETVTSTWGGAGLLVNNILTLGASVSFISIIDEDRDDIQVNLFSHPELKKCFIKIPTRKTPTKERFWIKNKKFLEWQHFDNDPLPLIQQKKLEKLFLKELKSAGKVIIADYRHGLLSQKFAQTIIQACAKAQKPVYVDSQIAYNKGNHSWYRGAYLICLNELEARSAYKPFSKSKLFHSLQQLQKVFKTSNIVVKLGGEGATALLGDTSVEVPAYAVRPKDTSGAGDAFLGCLATGDHLPTHDDIRQANIWAALYSVTIGTKLPKHSAFQKVLRQDKPLTKKIKRA